VVFQPEVKPDFWRAFQPVIDAINDDGLLKNATNPTEQIQTEHRGEAA
jgi:hypothetical protein